MRHIFIIFKEIIAVFHFKCAKRIPKRLRDYSIDSVLHKKEVDFKSSETNLFVASFNRKFL